MRKIAIRPRSRPGEKLQLRRPITKGELAANVQCRGCLPGVSYRHELLRP